jgi:hypothetical protein
LARRCLGANAAPDHRIATKLPQVEATDKDKAAGRNQQARQRIAGGTQSKDHA